MINNTVIITIVGMAIVTYIPRMLPLVFLNGKNMPLFVKGILGNVPFSALGALIVPGVFLINDDPLFGIIGATTAIIIALFEVNVIFVVLASIFVLSIYSYFVG